MATYSSRFNQIFCSKLDDICIRYNHEFNEDSRNPENESEQDVYDVSVSLNCLQKKRKSKGVSKEMDDTRVTKKLKSKSSDTGRNQQNDSETSGKTGVEEDCITSPVPKYCSPKKLKKKNKTNCDTNARNSGYVRKLKKEEYAILVTKSIKNDCI